MFGLGNYVFGIGDVSLVDELKINVCRDQRTD